MAERELVEQRIHEALATETQANALSQTLFHPGGLFAQLAATEEDRRVLAQSALFGEAQRRLSDLQQQEGAAFARTVAQVRPSIPGTSLILQLFEADAR